MVVLGDIQALSQKNATAIYNPLKLFKAISDNEYENLMQMIQSFEQQLLGDEAALKQELTLNVAVSMAFFMLVAKYYGFDTCPMHVHNVETLRSEFNIPDNFIPIGLIATGKSVDKKRNKGYRRPSGEFATFNGFQ